MFPSKSTELITILKLIPVKKLPFGQPGGKLKKYEPLSMTTIFIFPYKLAPLITIMMFIPAKK
jgi:hypothetical protein